MRTVQALEAALKEILQVHDVRGGLRSIRPAPCLLIAATLIIVVAVVVVFVRVGVTVVSLGVRRAVVLSEHGHALCAGRLIEQLRIAQVVGELSAVRRDLRLGGDFHVLRVGSLLVLLL